MSQTASSGSGFIISADGYVVSNYHVIKGASTLTVITSNGIEHNAKVVGYDEANELSVLKIKGTEFPFVRLGSSDELVVGSQVVAIGNPLGELISTQTFGYISAKDRLVNTDGSSMNMLQTDAAINSGNSGGPLFNMRGEVIGITTSKYSGASNSGAYIEGIGFALPMGALILEVVPGYCAERAGLRAGDIIVSIDGNKVISVTGLTRIFRMYGPGMEAQVTVYRAGIEQTFAAIFDEKPQSMQAPADNP